MMRLQTKRTYRLPQALHSLHAAYALCVSALVLCLFTLFGCNGGINPADYDQHANIRGTIHFVRGAGKANFPVDSIYDLRVVAFQNQPKDTNLIVEIAGGTAIYTETLYDSATFSFPSTLSYKLVVPQVQLANGAVEYRYIAVAQRYGTNIASDWRVAGLYSADSIFTPAVIRVQSGVDHDNIDFNVDFLKPPPQPFKR